MNTPFDKVIEGTKKAQTDTDIVILDQVRNEESFVVRLQADQMFDGYRGDGREIRPMYAPSTVLIKRQKGQPTQRVTLRDTGDFHDSIVIEYGPTEFRLDATDEKRPYLAGKYGEQIFGLDDVALDRLINKVREPIIRELQKMMLVNA